MKCKDRLVGASREYEPEATTMYENIRFHRSGRMSDVSTCIDALRDQSARFKVKS